MEIGSKIYKQFYEKVIPLNEMSGLQWFALKENYGNSYGEILKNYEFIKKPKLLDIGNGIIREKIEEYILPNDSSILIYSDPDEQYSGGRSNKIYHELVKKYFEKEYDGTIIDELNLISSPKYLKEDLEGPSEIVLWKDFDKLLKITNSIGGTNTASSKETILNSKEPSSLSNDIIKVDNLVIGAGIGGTYLSSRLKNFHVNESVLLVDKLDDYGGLQIGSKIPGSNTFIELGCIRFYPEIHTRINYLAKKYNLPLTQYLPDTKSSVYYLRDKKFTNKNILKGSETVYNIRENEKGIDPFSIIEKNLEKYFPSLDKLTLDLSYRIELFKNVELSKLVLQPEAQQNMSTENWNRAIDIIGYDNIFCTKINLTVGAIELGHLAKITLQYRFTNGYSSLTKTIAKKNNLKKIKFDDLNKNSFDIFKSNTLFSTAVLDIQLVPNKNVWKVIIGLVNVNSPEDNNYQPFRIKTIFVKKIFSTIPLIYLKNIHNFSNNQVNIFTNSFVDNQVVRIYLKFETDWMTENGIGLCKSITTLNGGQIVHYSDKVLMFYALNIKGSKLYNFIPDDIPLQKEMIKPNDSLHPLIEECLKIIKQTFNIKNLPKVNGLAYVTWVDTIRFHSGRNLQSLKDESLYDELMKIMFPYGKDGNFYILENTSSFNSGWCEGSLEIVDFYFNLIYNTPLFGETLIK